MTLNFAPLHTIWENAWNTAGRDSGTFSSPVVSLEKGEKREGWWEEGKGREFLPSPFLLPTPLALLSILKRDDWGRVRFRNTANRTHLREALFNFQFEISIDLVTVFDAILTSRQTREKLLCLCENLMSNNFRETAVLKNIWTVN